MTPLRWIGAIVVLLGVISLAVPIPHRERHGVQVGDVSLGVTTQSTDKVPLAVSVVVILAGLGVAAIGSRRSS
jgi:hypothetical protein